MTTLERLQAGYEFLADPLAWSRGLMLSSTGQRCAVGALYLDLTEADAKYDDLWYRSDDATDALFAALPRSFAMRYHNTNDRLAAVLTYNDARERTHDEIKAWFERAIQNTIEGTS